MLPDIIGIDNPLTGCVLDVGKPELDIFQGEPFEILDVVSIQGLRKRHIVPVTQALPAATCDGVSRPMDYISS